MAFKHHVIAIGCRKKYSCGIVARMNARKESCRCEIFSFDRDSFYMQLSNFCICRLMYRAERGWMQVAMPGLSRFLYLKMTFKEKKVDFIASNKENVTRLGQKPMIIETI